MASGTPGEGIKNILFLSKMESLLFHIRFSGGVILESPKAYTERGGIQMLRDEYKYIRVYIIHVSKLSE